MHTLHYRIQHDDLKGLGDNCAGSSARKWVSTDDMDQQTLSTGMQKCWKLVKKSG